MIDRAHLFSMAVDETEEIVGLFLSQNSVTRQFRILMRGPRAVIDGRYYCMISDIYMTGQYLK